jgi:Protein of unknown function (DUF2845)
MTRIGFWTMVAMLVSAGFGDGAQAFQGFRCGSGRLVDEGDQLFDVRNRCGDPDYADSHEEKRTVRRTVWTTVGGVAVAKEEEVTVSVMVDEWTYDLGPNRFIRHLAFEQNRLVRVWTTGRGKP